MLSEGIANEKCSAVLATFFHTKFVVPQLWIQHTNKTQCELLLIELYRKHIGFKCCDWHVALQEDHCKKCRLRYRHESISYKAFCRTMNFHS